jgi:hypothetical protein
VLNFNYKSGLKTLFCFPWIIPASMILSCLLLLPSLQIGFFFDDYFFLYQLSKENTSALPLDLYAFDFDFCKKFLHPWWSSPDLKIRFFRPLSSFFYGLDYSLFEEKIIYYHLHSMLWWIALLGAWGMIYKDVLPGFVGVLALLLCALGDAHGMAATWSANRNALVASVPIFWGLWAHIRWRQYGWSAGRWISICGYFLGLLGGELAVSALCYVASYEVLAGPGSMRKRIGSLIPLALICFLYVLVYRMYDFGVARSGSYIDPIGEFSLYAAAAAVRLPILAGDALLGLSADFWFVSSHVELFLAFLGIAALGMFYWGWQWGPLGSQEEELSFRWLAWGSALSLLPAVAAMPTGRQVLCTTFGASALVAGLMWKAWMVFNGNVIISKSKKIFLCFLAAWLGFAHLLIAPVYLVFVQYFYLHLDETTHELAKEMDQPEMQGRDIVLLHAPDHPIGLFTFPIIAVKNVYVPNNWTLLSMSQYDHVITRVDERSLRLRLLHGSLMRSPIETIFFRGLFKEGDKVDQGLFQATVEQVERFCPTQVLFEFNTSLDDSSWLFLLWQEGHLSEQRLPPIGQSVEIKKIPGPSGL